ncbi:MAG: alpha-L-fucosidase, partial [Anaerohalosphaera sp.]|nr:alpha-L-fucosidase [Anaerohalosphaera sp.]
MKKCLFLLLQFAILASVCFSQEHEQKYVPDPDPLVRQKLEQWQDIKFGLLMHWGT